MSLLIISFLAGILSVLAPCVLPVLPVILGGSLASNKRYRPIIIVLSLMFFIVFFTIILKVSTAFINIPQFFWTYFSAFIIISYGITLIRPTLWDRFAIYIGLNKANELSDKASKIQGLRGDILLGASLGPIFASCSPTYAILLSLVFPKSFALGLLYTGVYALGFGIFLLIVAYSGRALIRKLNPLANSDGWFKKILGFILIIVGLLISTGYIKKLETKFLDLGIVDVTKIEQNLLQNNNEFTNKNNQNNTKSDNTADIYISTGQKYLNVNYPAPELVGLTNWLNGNGYKSIKDLKGKVVIVDFWTYSCINCIRTLATMEKRHETYSDKGLVILGIHAPEFQFEKDPKNVKNAVAEYGLKYPIAQDNNMQTRGSFDNHYRPAKYIIDRDGNVRFTHFGEGGYEETEQVIQYLLGTGGQIVSNDKDSYNGNRSPETYLGSNRGDIANYMSNQELNQRRLSGDRSQNPENISLSSNNGLLFMNAAGSEINLVMGSKNGSKADIYIDDKLYKSIDIKNEKLYNLRTGDGGNHQLEIKFIGSGLEAFAFTFG